MRKLLVAGAIALGAWGIAGCGAASAPRGVAAPAAATGSVPATDSVTRILARAEAALRTVRSFHMEAITNPAGGLPRVISADFTLPGRVQIEYGIGGVALVLRIIGGRAYAFGDTQFWASRGTLPVSALSTVANRWVLIPRSAAWVKPFRSLTAAKFARCLTGDWHGPSVTSGHGSANGSPALVLTQRTPAPAGGTSRLYIAAGPTALPLQITESGDAPSATPSGRPCTIGTSLGPGASTLVRFNYKVAMPIPAPAHPTQMRPLLAAVANTVALAPASSIGAGQRAAQARLMGSWQVTGTVVMSHGFLDVKSGAIVSGQWTVRRRCRKGGCALFLVRRTGSVTSTGQLRWVGRGWTGRFATTTPCANGGSTLIHWRSWITVGHGSIAATEDATAAPCGHGPGATEVLEWSGEPQLPPAGTDNRA